MTSWIADDGVVALRPLTAADTVPHLAGMDEAVLRRLATNARVWTEAGPVVDLGLVEFATDALVGVVGFQRGLDYLAPGQVNLAYTLYAVEPAVDRGRRSSRLHRLACGR